MNIANQLIETLTFLEERRKGYKYSIKLSAKNKKWTCSVIGESTEDKSYPHDFICCQSDDFESLPALIKQKAISLLNEEVKRNEERIEAILLQNKKLQAEHDLIVKLQI